MSDPSHQAAWNEARALLAAAERAAASDDSALLGTAVAHADTAIALLARVLTGTTHPVPRRLLGAAWLLRARALTRLGTPAAIDDAVHALDAAINHLGNPPGEPDPQIRFDLALALQHAGNLRQLRGAGDDRQIAIACYDRSIDVLRGLPLESKPALHQLLGAVWLNRGATWVRLDDPSAAAEARRSFDEAIAVWRTLPAEATPAQPINLGAAWMNRAHALLRQSEQLEAATQVRAAVAEALALVGPWEREHASAADIGLKARHIACRAIGLQLAATDGTTDSTRADLFASASDIVDDGLALARHWARRGEPMPFAFVADLFRFGAQTYLEYQPHFLAEFVLENLDPQNSEDPLPWHDSLQAVAVNAVALALRELDRPQLHTIGAPEAERRIASLQDLRAAAARLTALRPSQSAP